MIDDDLLTTIFKDKQIQYKNIIDAMPQSSIPVVTIADVDNGFITRYFVRPVSQRTNITEVNSRDYQLFKTNVMFVSVEIKWLIIGKKDTVKLGNGIALRGVEDRNRIAVSNADLTFGGLLNYIGNYLQYWVSE